MVFFAGVGIVEFVVPIFEMAVEMSFSEEIVLPLLTRMGKLVVLVFDRVVEMTFEKVSLFVD